MKAVRFHEFGDPGVLRYEDIDRPTPGPGEVLVRVAASGFNAVDAGIRGGYLQGPFPSSFRTPLVSRSRARLSRSARVSSSSRSPTTSSRSCR